MKTQFAETIVAAVRGDRAVLRERCRAAPGRVLAAIATLLLLAGVSFQANASCEAVWRISDTSSTCFSAVITDAAFGGGWYTVTGQCSTYGTVKVKLDIVDGADKVLTLTKNSPIHSGEALTNIRNAKCCLDTSDLCWKDQVEKNSAGRIKQIIIDGSTVTSRNVDVSTHEKRYDFCEDNPNNIYCVNDPEGDAFTNPYSGDCGGLRCRRQHCADYFATSPAVTGTSACGTLSWYVDSFGWTMQRPLDNNECRPGRADCTDSAGTSVSADVQSADGTIGDRTPVNVHNMDELVYCEWIAQYGYNRKRIVEGDCPEDDPAYAE